MQTYTPNLALGSLRAFREGQGLLRTQGGLNSSEFRAEGSPSFRLETPLHLALGSTNHSLELGDFCPLWLNPLPCQASNVVWRSLAPRRSGWKQTHTFRGPARCVVAQRGAPYCLRSSPSPVRPWFSRWVSGLSPGTPWGAGWSSSFAGRGSCFF